MAIDRARRDPVPSRQPWTDAWAGLTPLQLCAEHGRLWMADLMAGLFWPEFVAHDQMILLADRATPEGLAQRHRQFGGDPRAIERAVNNTSLWDLFPHDVQADASMAALAGLLGSTWLAKLRQEYPDRDFHVEVVPTSPHRHGPTVTFCQVGPRLSDPGRTSRPPGGAPG